MAWEEIYLACIVDAATEGIGVAGGDESWPAARCPVPEALSLRDNGAVEANLSQAVAPPSKLAESKGISAETFESMEGLSKHLKNKTTVGTVKNHRTGLHDKSRTSRRDEAGWVYHGGPQMCVDGGEQDGG